MTKRFPGKPGFFAEETPDSKTDSGEPKKIPAYLRSGTLRLFKITCSCVFFCRFREAFSLTYQNKDEYSKYHNCLIVHDKRTYTLCVMTFGKTTMPGQKNKTDTTTGSV